MFVVPAVVLGLVSYYDDPSIVSSCIIGIGCGVICSGMAWRRISAERRGQSPPPEAERANARRGVVRLVVSASILVGFSVIAVAAHSFAILVVGVALSVLVPLALRALRR
jgi:hypothetical protein